MTGTPGTRPVLAVLLGALASCCAGCMVAPADGPDERAAEMVVTQVPGDAVPAGALQRDALDRRYPAGSRVVVARAGAPAGSVRVLSRGLDAAGAPDVSPDGKTVVFAARQRPGSRWGIFETSVRGGRPRRIVDLDRDCGDPAYGAGEAVLFACADGPSWSLYVLATREAPPERISFGARSAFDPSPLPDGRVLFSMSDEAGTHEASLFVVNPDGSLLSALSGHHLEPSAAHRARPTADGHVVYLAAERSGDAVRVARLDLARPDEPPGEVALSTGTPTAIEPLAHGGFLVAGGPTDSAVYATEPDGGGLRVVFDDPDRHEMEAVPLTAAAPPRGRPSALHDRPGVATVICYDTNRSDGIAGPPAGAPRAASLLVQRRYGSEEGSASVEDVGTATVAHDGSAFLEVPADTAIRVRTLDGHGSEIATSDWFWLRSGEVRACFGCHEGHEAAPRNRMIAALAGDPVPLSGAAAGASP
jgi:hypothetical protein